MSLSIERYSYKFGKFEVFQRKGDGYFDGTSMCKVGKKLFYDWRRLKSTDLFLAALSRDMGPICKLVIITIGGNTHGSSWIHPEVAIHLAMWVNPEFAVQVIKWASRFIAGDVGLIVDILDRNDVQNESRTMATITTVQRQSNVTQQEFEAHHMASAERHAGSKRARDSQTSCAATNLSKCSKTGVVVASTEWIEKTQAIDKLWEAMQDALPWAKILGECRIVYFMREDATELVKVGFSADTIARLGTLQCGNGSQLKLEYQVPTTRFAELERAIHVLLTERGQHVRGEWFRLALDVQHAEIVMEACCNMD